MKCNFCGRPLPGMIIDPKSQLGIRLNELIAGFRCNSCTEKLDEELRLANSWSGLGGNRSDTSEVSPTNVRCDVSEVAATNGTDSLAAVDSTSEITNKNTAVRNSNDSPGTDAES